VSGTQDVELLNAKKLMRQMKHVGYRGSLKALRAGIGKAVALLRKSIRSEIPAKDKAIKKSVGSKVKINKKDGVVAKVGLNIGKKKGRGYAPHAILYVAGTVPRVQKKTGRPTGRMPANPVVQKGVAAGEAQAKRGMTEKMAEVLKTEAGKS
jgi:HK97 gp10 family phage protein